MNVITVIGAAIAFVVIVAAIFALVTQWAWNTVMPSVFGLPTVTLLQAFALNLLAGALIKSNNFNTRKD